MWKRLFFVLLILVLLTAVALGFLWRRATAPPAWYEEQRAGAVETAEPGTLERARRELKAKLRPRDAALTPPSSSSLPPSSPPATTGRRAGGGGGGRGLMELRLDERELGSLLATVLADHGDGRRLLAMSHGLAARLDGGRLEAGMMVRLPRESDPGLDADERELARDVEEHASFLAGREVFVAVSGRPVARDGRLGLDHPRLQAGPISISGPSIVERLGIDPRELEQGVALEWGRLRDVEIEGGELVLVLEP